MKKSVEERPWGKFERFCLNEQCTVKIIFVKPNESLSLQYHTKREEWWRVISGSGTFLIGDETEQGTVGDEFFVPREARHRMETGDEPLEILEISFGEFDENDIVRLEDKYNRV